jgi:serine palmitoyltransferase
MSFNKRASSRSALNKASTNEPARDASALLAAVKQADARARVKPTSKMTPTPPPTATPALSLSSSVTRESDTSLSSLSSQGFPSAQSQIHSRSLLATGFQSKADYARINEEETDPYVVQWGDDGLGVPTVPPTSEQHADARHTEFGHCWNEDYRRTSSHPADRRFAQAVEQEPPYYVAITTYISYMILIMVGHFRDFLMRRTSNAESRQLREHDVS